MIRNLLYNCCPSDWSDEWRDNVARLCRYPEAFNGRKLVIVRTGENMRSIDDVRAEFRRGWLDADVEFLEIENHTKLHEVHRFIETLELLQSVDPNEATFYAHTKGVRYDGVPERRMDSVRQWRNEMYDGCLADIPKIERALQSHPCAGCFMQANPVDQVVTNYFLEGKPLTKSRMEELKAEAAKGGKHTALLSKWHYAGTFWWVKHSSLFTLPNWRFIIPSRYGVEAYLGHLIPLEDAHALNDLPSFGLYSNLGTYECGNCGNVFGHRELKMKCNPIKTCPACLKRRGEWIGGPDTMTDAA